MASKTQTLITQLRAIDQSTFKENDDDRLHVLWEAEDLCRRLEKPINTMLRLIFTDPAYIFALHLASEISLFSTLTETRQSTTSLATSCSIDPLLLRRITRHLAAHKTILEHGPDLWSATPHTRALAQDDGKAMIRRAVEAPRTFAPGLAFFRENGWRNPGDARDTLFQRAYGCPGETQQEFVQRADQRDVGRDFYLMMAFAARYAPGVFEVCPMEGILGGLRGGEGEVAVVDVGGGLGVLVEEFRVRFPRVRVPGRVVLQDLPRVIEAARARGVEGGSGEGSGASGEVELQVHDFWTPQPVRGARVYLLSRILHDWADAEAGRILRHLVEAMERGYSKLMIFDNLLADVGCNPLLSGLDLQMMAGIAGKERTETEWRVLLEGQGLRIVKIHEVPSSLTVMIETELAG